MNIKECQVKFYQSQRRISYIHLCKNTKPKLSFPGLGLGNQDGETSALVGAGGAY